MKKLFLTLTLTLLAVFVFAPAVSAQVSPLGDACAAVETGQRPEICDTPSTNPVTGADGVIIKAANLVATVTGVAAVIIIIVAGLQYITAAGEANKVSGAKQSIIFAIVGLIIVLVARTLVIFIIRRL